MKTDSSGHRIWTLRSRARSTRRRHRPEGSARRGCGDRAHSGPRGGRSRLFHSHEQAELVGAIADADDIRDRGGREHVTHKTGAVLASLETGCVRPPAIRGATTTTSATGAAERAAKERPARRERGAWWHTRPPHWRAIRTFASTRSGRTAAAAWSINGGVCSTAAQNRPSLSGRRPAGTKDSYQRRLDELLCSRTAGREMTSRFS
jgi:hypothetical protein